jgi:hypothetical protein
VKLSACRKLRRFPVRIVWYRAVDLKYLNNPLGTAHTPRVASRFSVGPYHGGGYEVLYLCAEALMTLLEVRGIFGTQPGYAVSNPHFAWAVLNVEVLLWNVADLTLESQRALIQTSRQELTGDWESYSRRVGRS